MLYRYTMLFQLNTAPEDQEAASVHTAGWSESLWHEQLLTTASPQVGDLLRTRAGMLPKGGAIVGLRIAAYDPQVSSLVPKGASTSRIRYVGSPTRPTDLPNVALMFSGSANSGNATRYSCKGIPDGQMVNGEYQPDASFKRAVTLYVASVGGNSWGFIGRNLAATQAKVMSIANGIMTTNVEIAPTIGETIVTFIKVRDTTGKPIVGNFRIKANPGDKQYTLDGLSTNIVVGAQGYARVLTPIFCNLSSLQPTRAVVRKIGRPFESYRGRASKRRTA